ncbi:hypothetical protein [Streptacidiphilus sp. EB129]|uniref:hypothetical protein n=1 Tax=Streptacidiphilus sp. EB129 TaxID=3156262 RepID=UPI0035153128
MTGPKMAGDRAARARAQAVLRTRGRAAAVATLPAAIAAVLIAGGITGRLGAAGAADALGWDVARWAVGTVGVLVLLLAGVLALVLARVTPPQTPAVPIEETAAPELYRMVRDLAERMDVPAPARIALTPDCDSWLEDPPARSAAGTARRAAAAPGAGGAARAESAVAGGAGAETEPADALGRDRAPVPAPTLVVGSPFLWWMRVAELRALLAPVVAGTACSADPDIAAARRYVRGLDATLGLAADRHGAPAWQRPGLALFGRIAAVLLRRCRGHAAEMERAVAGWASEQARQVDYGLRIAAQEQVGLAYAGWDRLLSRVALPAWRIGRWPARLDAGVVSALTELSRRDRLADAFETRLGERPACDLLEEPGTVDAAVSLLAARLFHGGGDPAADRAWSPVDWADYPTAVVEGIWRSQAADLTALLDPGSGAEADPRIDTYARTDSYAPAYAHPGAEPDSGVPGDRAIARLLDRLRRGPGAADELASALTARRLRASLGELPQPALQLQPPRTGRDLLGEHLAALVCCAAIDAGAARPGLDWLDGPVLLVDGVRRGDLAVPVALAVDHGDDGPLRAWLDEIGVRVQKTVRLP